MFFETSKGIIIANRKPDIDTQISSQSKLPSVIFKNWQHSIQSTKRIGRYK